MAGTVEQMHRRLAAPFPAEALEWKVQKSGQRDGEMWALIVPYVSARAVTARLDEVCGPDGWEVHYTPVAIGPKGGLLARLRLRFDGGDRELERWVERQDGADLTDIEPIKGGVSGALKRAAVMFGVGAYLYGSPPVWANVHAKGRNLGVYKDKKTNARHTFKWDPPADAIAALTAGAPSASAQVTGRDVALEAPGPRSRAPEKAAPAAPAADGLEWPTSCPECGGKLWDNRGEGNPNMKCRDKACGFRVYHDKLDELAARGVGAPPPEGPPMDDDDSYLDEAFGPPVRGGR